MISEGLNSNK